MFQIIVLASPSKEGGEKIIKLKEFAEFIKS